MPWNGWGRDVSADHAAVWRGPAQLERGLSLKRGDVPLGETLYHPGQGLYRERMVPVLLLLRGRDRIFMPGSIRWRRPGHGMLFLSRRGQADEPARERQALMQRLRGRLGLRRNAPRRTALRHFFRRPHLAGGGDLRSVQDVAGKPRTRFPHQTYTALETRQLAGDSIERLIREGEPAESAEDEIGPVDFFERRSRRCLQRGAPNA